jgi:hypothetical protein
VDNAVCRTRRSPVRPLFGTRTAAANRLPCNRLMPPSRAQSASIDSMTEHRNHWTAGPAVAATTMLCLLLASAHDLGVGLAFVECRPLGSPLVAIGQLHIVQSEQPQDRGMQVVDVQPVADGVQADLVRLA